VRSIAIARNYADTLFELARRADDLEAWGALLDATAAAMTTPSVEAVMMSPRVTRDRKIAIVSEALKDAPRPFVLFLIAMIRRGRQVLIDTVADEYRALVDDTLGRVRAGITVAREIDEAAKADLVARLAKAIDKEVIAGFVVDPAILGGTVVRIGSQVYDGTVRKRLSRLRRRLLTG
jgi:F-type H+-transporting ATPase subunit delta